MKKTPPVVNAFDFMQTLKKYLPRRNPNANKADFGHIFIIGGDAGFSGAVRLAGEAAYRVGAGLVTILTHPTHAATLNLNCPELMCLGISDVSEIKQYLTSATVVILGPGLGKSDWGESIFNAFFRLKLTLPLVLDADGLNWLSESPTMHADHWILTPHPGEAARLLAKTTKEIQGDRLAAAQKVQHQYGGICVLKGQNTLIQGQSLLHCPLGNPGMASAGMGDVLSGVIGGLLAQHVPPEVAAGLGVYIHASAGDAAAKAGGERGLMASDLMPFLRGTSNSAC